MIFSALAALALFSGLPGCGVKGDPLPPDKPPTLGRGKPTYKRATEAIPIEKIPVGKPGQLPEDENVDDE